MSWHYVVANINTAFKQMVDWYRIFMEKTERSFVALHGRVLYLEQRQAWQGPSDEQVERVLRKLLAEKFANMEPQRVDQKNVMGDGEYFVKPPGVEFILPTAEPMDIAKVTIDSNAVPSREYAETLEMLNRNIRGFPHVELSNGLENRLDRETEDHHINIDRPEQSTHNQQHDRPWM